ncbi:MAG: hypothetical protein KGS72_27575 [Cyanobacteria bacterium REEB67]|nr:hypothetical protein [Cyanobacteria bacterium REEB67]
MNTIKRMLTNLAVFAAVFLPLYFFVPFDLSSLNVHGWGWAIVIGSGLVCSIASSFLVGFFGSIVKDKVEIHPEVAHVLDEIRGWLSVGAAFVIGAWLAPSLVTADAAPILLYWGIFGIASGVADVVAGRLGYGTKRSY